MNLILFGPPGAGKGTQAEFIVKKEKLTHVTTTLNTSYGSKVFVNSRGFLLNNEMDSSL